jgi:hypothetical protein
MSESSNDAIDRALAAVSAMVAVAGVTAVAAAAAAVEAAGAGEEAFSADETNMRCMAGSILAMTASMISSAEAPVQLPLLERCRRCLVPMPLVQ